MKDGKKETREEYWINKKKKDTGEKIEGDMG
jgi:hypothetical protein